MTQVLDKGEVILIDHMAGDHKVYGAARVSTGKAPGDSSKGEVQDRGLVKYLMQHRHGTPFEHAVFQWYVKAPIFVFREWHRHRIASYNEQSGRYSKFEAEFYIPDHVRGTDPANKQSTVRLEDDRLLDLYQQKLEENYAGSYAAYEELLDAGVGKEMARILLPVAAYSRMWWTVNCRALMNFLELRNAPGAQFEIQEYARVLEEDFKALMPWTHEAFVTLGRNTP